MSRILTLLLLLLASTHLFAQDKYSKVSIPLKDPAAKAFVFDRLEVDHYAMKDGAMEVILDQDELSLLRLSGFPYRLLVDDYVAYTTEKNRRIGENWQQAEAQARTNMAISCKQASAIFAVPTAFGNGGSLRLGAASGTGYYTYAEMVTKMQALAAANPTRVSVFNIGTSQNGTVTYGIKISDNVGTDESEPEVLYTGLQHAREAIGGTSLIYFAMYLAENYSLNDRIKELVDNREIFIIPCLNPDGYAQNYSGAAGYPTTGGGLWRKNRRLISGTTYGVDINRNYSVDWGNCAGASTSCGSNTASQDTYYGPSAFSEKETQNVRTFVTGRKFVAAIDQHCYGPYYSLPFGRPSLHSMSTLDSYFYTAIPALMGTYNCHRAGNSPETVNYEVAGGIKDWLLMGDIGTGTKGKIYGMTGEAGGGDFWAPISQIKTLCAQNCMQNIQLAYSVGSYYDVQDASDVAMSAKSGSLSFTIRNIGLTVGQATVSLVPIENIAMTGSAPTFTPTNYYDSYSGTVGYTLPNAIKPGYRVRFAWKVTAGGISVYDTVTKIYSPTTLLYDDMEGSFSTNWTSTSNATGTSANWAFTTNEKYGGTHALTESPSTTATAVNYTTSTTRTLTYKNAMDFSDVANAYLSFWVKHRAENCRDKLQVQLSTSPTFASNVSTLCGSHTVSEPSATGSGSLGGNPALTGIRDQWTRVSYDLGGLKGNPAVYLRFVFTSDADLDNFAYELDDGFYLDNIKVVKTTQVFDVLPVKFLRFTGHLQPDGRVRLDWEANTDAQHDYFEVERSADGIHFTTLGRPNPNPPYIMYDLHPEAGSNHYRVKQVDRSGRITYSNIVLINVQLQVQLNIFPNPAHDRLRIELQSTRPGTLLLHLRDLQGRSLWQHTSSGSGNLQVPLSGWAAGTYLLQVHDKDGHLLSTQRIVKL
ncbi:MAG: T9SS type A sorting domain-containing protein [Chitinophagaceae bacterium]|nr:MAG: T9SS type A sorting domain-containing protein [Chitinophagaceae bacterium]